MVVRWTLLDPATSDSYQFEVNPNEGGTPPRKKTVSSSPTTASDGINVLFQGMDEPQEMTFSGTLFTSQMFDAFVNWWKKQRQVQLTDDIGRSYWIYITEFAPTLVRSSNYPDKHKFECKAIVLDWS
jgi:hypothetical protein